MTRCVVAGCSNSGNPVCADHLRKRCSPPENWRPESMRLYHGVGIYWPTEAAWMLDSNASSDDNEQASRLGSLVRPAGLQSSSRDARAAGRFSSPQED